MTPRLLAHGPFLGEHPHLTPALSSPGEEREKWSVQPAFPLRPTGPSGPDGASAPRAYARSQANGVSARRLREMNKFGEGRGELGDGSTRRAAPIQEETRDMKGRSK